MSFILLIIILAICLFLEGFFSGSEMAVVNADKYRLAVKTEKRSSYHPRDCSYSTGDSNT